MIEIQNIKTEDAENIVDLLLDQQQQPFKIYFPKYSKLYFSENTEIADDYARLAFVGHKLKQSSDELEYDVVDPQIHESVLFEVKAKDFESLANCLLELSYLFENSHSEESGEDNLIWDEVYQYVEDVNNELIDPVCPEFVEIFFEYNNEVRE